MKGKVFLVITSIANADNKAMGIYAKECHLHNVGFIVIGDSKSPVDFKLNRCDFYGIDRQKMLPFKLAKYLPTCTYSRKNLGYLVALSMGAEIIIETDDDNLPYSDFWNERISLVQAHTLLDKGWVNTYKYFTKINTWPRGFALEYINSQPVILNYDQSAVSCPIQQGLADDNPDVDAIYRLTSSMPIKFACFDNIALGYNSWCPFNSQNTTWFKEAFPLLYLPTHCSFRMTDIWRSFIAQRIAWTNNWNILHHKATVYQERNEHDLILDFKDEVPGYINNGLICKELLKLDLKSGSNNIFENMRKCYNVFIDHQLVAPEELSLLDSWFEDFSEMR